MKLIISSRLYTVFISIFLLLTGSTILQQQPEGEIIIVSKKVGKTIDPEEKEKYKLFPGKEGFVEAVFMKFKDGSYGAKITCVKNGKLKTYIQKLPDGLKRIKKIKDYIDHFEEIQKGTYKPGEKEKEGLFREFRLNIKNLGKRNLEDINNDGLTDIVYIDNRKLSFFLQDKNGFSNTPDQTIIIDSSAFIFDIGDIDKISPGKEIVLSLIHI